MERFKLIVGDWSHDGHEKTSEVIVECSHTMDEVVKAHEFLKEEGVDLLSQCDDYEDDELTDDFLTKLTDMGIDLVRDLNAFSYGGKVYIDGKLWARLYMRLAQSKIEGLTYKFVSDNIPTTCIGGYGLFD